MTVLSSATFPKHPIIYWTCYGAILLLAVLFRILPIRSGLPYSDYVDEGHVLHQTIDAFNHKGLDVYWYGLPALTAYSTGAALFLYGPLYRHFHGHGFQRDLPNDRSRPSSRFNYDLIAPVELFVAGRLVTVCLSVASVILAGVIAARLANYRAGLLAMLFMAICPALVTRASIVIVDTFAAFFVLFALYFCLRIQAVVQRDVAPNRPQAGGYRSHGAMLHPSAIVSKTVWRYVALAGLGTGLVFASKYPVAIVGVALVTTILLLPFPWHQRLRLMLPATGGVVLGILLGAPMTFFKPISVWRDVAENIRAYAQIHSPQGYFVQAVSMFELGVPLLLLGIAGIILMLRQTKTRTAAIAWVLFATMLIASYQNSSFRPFRSFLSLVPLLCVTAAMAISGLADWARAGPQRWLRFGVTAILLCACLGSLGFSSFQQVERRMAHRDSRIRAVDWLQQHALESETILAIRELSILPAEWERIAAKCTVVPLSEAPDLLARQRFDYVVTGEFDLRQTSDVRAWSDYRDRWRARVSDLASLANFGQVATPVVLSVWRTNDERILILKGNEH